jgi:hypothetical protein
MTVASIALRPVIRDIMKMASSRRWSEAALLAQIRVLMPDAKAIDVQAALIWNQGQAYVESGINEEMECDVWTLTQKGKDA